MITLNGWRMIAESAVLMLQTWYSTTSPPVGSQEMGVTCSIQGNTLTIQPNRASPGFSESTFLSVYNAVTARTYGSSYDGAMFSAYNDNCTAIFNELVAVLPTYYLQLQRIACEWLSPSPKRLLCDLRWGDAEDPERNNPTVLYAWSADSTIITTIGGILDAVSPVPALVGQLVYTVTLDPLNDPAGP